MLLQRILCSLSLLAIAAAMLNNDFAKAETLGYWRFESGEFLSDSSGNGRDLTTNTGPATQVNIPSNFLNPVPPVTGLTNTMAAELPGTGLFSAPDDDAYTSNILTIEAIIRPESLSSGTSVLVSQHDSTIDERGWYLGISPQGTLRNFVSSDGINSSMQNQFSGEIVPGNDYYVATSFSVGTGIGQYGENFVGNLYLQDLTNGGPLRIANFASYAPITTINNVPGALAIGSTSTPGGTANFSGIIDEVRISNSLLEPSELLAYHPGIQLEYVTNISGSFVDSSIDGSIQSLAIDFAGNRTTYSPADLVGSRLTQFGGGDFGDAEFIMPPGSTDAPAPMDRANTLGDNIADTAFINMESWTVAFDQDLTNRPGPDIVLLDWGGGTADTVDITIDGTTLDDETAYGGSAFQSLGGRPRFLSDQFTVNTLELLESATFSANGTTGASNGAFLIDLSDFGYGDGAIFTSGTEVAFSDGEGIDPMEIFGLLEPTFTAGDFNQDGDVDGADFLIWQRNPSVGSLSDWQSNYGFGSLAAISPVPEPSTLFLTLLAAGLVFRRRTHV